MTATKAAQATHDYVVVGGGSSGSVVAGRLAEAGASVLLIEAGPGDRRPEVAIPAMMRRTYEQRNWRYDAEPDASRHGKVQQWSAGRSLGGGGAINGMVFVRGNPADYDSWAKEGCEGWDYESILPSFRRMETWSEGATDTRGGSGPIGVTRQGMEHPAIQAFIAAAAQQGHAVNDDYNGARQEGVSISQVNQRRGLRSHASKEYLRKLHHLGRLDIITGALVERVVLEGRRAVGVDFRVGSTRHSVRASHEIVLSAGAIGTPKILMLSGIGPRAELDHHDIRLVLDCPGVGANLQDHCSTPVHFETPLSTVNKVGPIEAIRAATTWALHGTGPIAASPMQTQLFQRLDPSSVSPDMQAALCCFAVQRTVDKSGKAVAGLAKVNGIHVWTINLHPRSRGRIRLRSGDPGDRPVIEHELLPPDDLEFMLNAIERIQDLMARPALNGIVGELFPSERANRTRADWTEWLRNNTTYGIHQVGTCKMGTDDLAVVDPNLRVHGIDGLRVIDGSIMPAITSGNTNAPSMMIGERGAELLLGSGRGR